MSGPDRIWAYSRGAGFGGNWGGEGGFCHLTGGTEYIRRDPAVLAALPELQALIAEAVDAEREACAQMFGPIVAAAISKRGER